MLVQKSGVVEITHFIEVRVDRNSLLAVEEYRSSFSLGGGSHDGADGLAFGEDRRLRVILM